ncbi:acyltransferase family protein [Rhodococcus hoagii]|nr:acyltransferase family protein [Prescottella equi]
MRGFAAFGVLVTHVAFQTGATGDAVIGRIWGRFDLAVAVFFALSGSCCGVRTRPRPAVSGVRRPSPGTGSTAPRASCRPTGCWLCWCWRPAGGRRWLKVWMSNLALLQVFVPLTLTEGLTQMWSLSVEVAFYLVLPILALALVKLRGDSARFRVPVLLAAAIVSLTWAFCPSRPDGIHHDNWLPATSRGSLPACCSPNWRCGRDVGAPPGRAAGMDGGDRGRGLRVVDDVAGRARGTGPRRAVAVRTKTPSARS